MTNIPALNSSSVFGLEPSQTTDIEYIILLKGICSKQMLQLYLSRLASTSYNSLEQYAYSEGDEELTLLEDINYPYRLAVAALRESYQEPLKLQEMLAGAVHLLDPDYKYKDTRDIVVEFKPKVKYNSVLEHLNSIRNTISNTESPSYIRVQSIILAIKGVEPTASVKVTVAQYPVFLSANELFVSTFGKYGAIMTKAHLMLTKPLTTINTDVLFEFVDLITSTASNIKDAAERYNLLTRCYLDICRAVPFLALPYYSDSLDLLMKEVYDAASLYVEDNY